MEKDVGEGLDGRVMEVWVTDLEGDGWMGRGLNEREPGVGGVGVHVQRGGGTFPQGMGSGGVDEEVV